MKREMLPQGNNCDYTHLIQPSSPTTYIDEITPSMVKWLSSIKEKNLNYCGKLVLTGDMSTLSITKVDLSNMNTLEGKSCCLKATH